MIVEVHKMGQRATLYSIPRLAAIRRALFLNQKEFAKKIGISRTAVSGLESGKKATPETVKKLAEALGMTREELIRP